MLDINWSSQDNTDKEANLEKIREWWSNLGGKQIDWRMIQGKLTNGNTGQEQLLLAEQITFNIEDPVLEAHTLSYKMNGSTKQLKNIQQLKLDLKTQALKVFYNPNVTTAYEIFTLLTP